MVKEGILQEGKDFTTQTSKFGKVNSLITEIICDVNGVCCCLLDGKLTGENH